ncbi:hypothetical protein V6N12_050998 [Hibiscus sabdariffa]|uniref:Cathepsin propeptide inhibitor domain-containing protein n=1 Tax=Hibiscus sabdariffa TaxID=183260 RepID=A0ABR2GF92_9ROSI
MQFLLPHTFKIPFLFFFSRLKHGFTATNYADPLPHDAHFILSSRHVHPLLRDAHPDRSMSSWRADGEVMAMYEEWLLKHGKAYNGLGEKDTRFEIFKDNLRLIDEHNADHARSFKLGLNRFADLTNDEYRSTYVGLINPTRRFPRQVIVMRRASVRCCRIPLTGGKRVPWLRSKIRDLAVSSIYYYGFLILNLLGSALFSATVFHGCSSV